MRRTLKHNGRGMQESARANLQVELLTDIRRINYCE
jgi:hypothetical protein